MVGVIDVGGGLRGIYGAGVFDWCMDHDIRFAYAIGVSAGAANLASFTARQPGRNYPFYSEYCFRKEYMGLRQKVRTGSFLNLEAAQAQIFQCLAIIKSHKTNLINIIKVDTSKTRTTTKSKLRYFMHR